MIQLEILGRTAIHTTGPVAAIDCIDHLARNRRALWLIPEELARIDKLHPDLFFKFATALPFFQLRGYLRLFPFRGLLRPFRSTLLPFRLAPLLFFQILLIALMLALFPSLGFQIMLAPELGRTLLLGALFFPPPPFARASTCDEHEAKPRCATRTKGKTQSKENPTF